MKPPAKAIRARGLIRGSNNLLKPGITWHKLKYKSRILSTSFIMNKKVKDTNSNKYVLT